MDVREPIFVDAPSDPEVVTRSLDREATAGRMGGHAMTQDQLDVTYADHEDVNDDRDQDEEYDRA